MDNEIFMLDRMVVQFSIWKKPKIWWWIQRHHAWLIKAVEYHWEKLPYCTRKCN
jgi:hypothetical protein